MQRTMLLVGTLILFPLNSVCALGLGELNVQSVMNQRLDARIDLTSVKTGDIVNMTVRLADADVFKSAGLPRPYHLTQLKFEPVETAENAGYIRVTSKERIREPYLNFIIEVSWPNGKLLREYTVILRKP
jgi:pilus assembly protein FimV